MGPADWHHNLHCVVIIYYYYWYHKSGRTAAAVKCNTTTHAAAAVECNISAPFLQFERSESETDLYFIQIDLDIISHRVDRTRNTSASTVASI